MARYTVLFGYRTNYTGCGDEWEKYESDDLQAAVKFWTEYPSSTNFEKPGYVYIQDEETGEVVDGYWTEVE